MKKRMVMGEKGCVSKGWLPSNISDFKRHAKTRFTQDSFIEAIDFDYLEIQIIEED